VSYVLIILTRFINLCSYVFYVLCSHAFMMSYLCFLISVNSVSLHLMSYCNFVSAREGRCKYTFSALPSLSYFVLAFVVAKYCHFELNKWRWRDDDDDDDNCVSPSQAAAAVQPLHAIQCLKCGWTVMEWTASRHSFSSLDAVQPLLGPMYAL